MSLVDGGTPLAFVFDVRTHAIQEAIEDAVNAVASNAVLMDAVCTLDGRVARVVDHSHIELAESVGSRRARIHARG